MKHHSPSTIVDRMINQLTLHGCDQRQALAGVGLPHESADFLQGLVYLTLSAVVRMLWDCA